MNDDLPAFCKTLRWSVRAEFQPKQGSWCRQHSADAETETVTPATELLMDALPDFGECSERIANEAMIVGQLSRAEVRSFSLNQSSPERRVILARGSEELEHNWRSRITARKLVAANPTAVTGGGSAPQMPGAFASRNGNKYFMNLERIVARVAKEPVVSAHK